MARGSEFYVRVARTMPREHKVHIFEPLCNILFIILSPIVFYNMIASRATQSNSVYVSVLKIPIVHADGVSKSLRQKVFFFARAAIVSEGKSIIFGYNNGHKQRLGPLVPKRRQFSDLFSWARVLE